MPEPITLSAHIPLSMSGERIDKVLSQLFPDYSRALLSKWLKDGAITVNEQVLLPKNKVAGGELIKLCANPQRPETWQAQTMDLSIVYEDCDLLMVNKPAGLVVHPGAGNPDSTLVNGLLFHRPELAQLPRSGIIHRLDKDTSGLLIVAKTLIAHHHLIDMMQQRLIKRHYYAIVCGHPGKGVVDAPIARHPKNRLKMAVVASGKRAITHYKSKKKYPHHSLLDIELETGRTHQIRVHMAHILHPIVGDPLYGTQRLNAAIKPHCRDSLRAFPRQALHAYRLHLTHPLSKKSIDIKTPIPEDFSQLIHTLDESRD